MNESCAWADLSICSHLLWFPSLIDDYARTALLSGRKNSLRRALASLRDVKVGDHLIDIADLTVVWVSAEFYESELSMLQTGQSVTVTSSSYPNDRFEGQVAVISPFLEQTKRTAKVRIDIPNPDFKLRPGMYANVELGMEMGEGLTVPASAVMPTGEREIAFVDKGDGKLEPRVVQLGEQIGDQYEVKSGLAEGERVVASANFLIDAESKVQGALKDFAAAPPEHRHQ